MTKKINNASFRDPSGFVYIEDGVIYRQVNLSYKEDYDLFIRSGLYQELLDKKLIVPHIECDEKSDEFYRIIQPKKIDFISYPYEWAFSQLKDAALLTLKVQQESLKKGMSLKDATSYNVQFQDGCPVFIDTLSFEKYKDNKPWLAYKQFCQHFLAPLVLMSYVDVSSNQLLRTNIDGIPLSLACNYLPIKAKFNFGILLHIFMHSSSQKQYEDSEDQGQLEEAQMSLFSQEALIDSLISTVKSLKLPQVKTEWGDYYDNTNYTDASFKYKKKLVSEFIDIVQPKTLCDLGANKGDFSRVVAVKDIKIISCDIDPVAVEKNYLKLKKDKEKNILPMIQDLTNPSPSIGFNSEERESFKDRAKCDLTMALALIHHMAISNNLPFANIASSFSEMSNYLVIEFVPKEDSKVQKLLSTREDIFSSYSQSDFENEFGKYYDIVQSEKIQGSERVLYLMKTF